MTASTLTADNGASSGTSGIKYNGGTDGTLQIQTTTSGGTATTAVTIDNSQNVTLAGTLTGNGSGLTTLNASNLASGTVGTARLGSGTASSTTYLRGDQTWAAVSTGLPGVLGQVFTSNGTFTIPSGVTAIKVTVLGGGGGGTTLSGCCVPTGNTGGTSSVASGTQTISTISATGGAGGRYANPASPSAGGAGSGGDLNIFGGSGGPGYMTGASIFGGNGAFRGSTVGYGGGGGTSAIGSATSNLNIGAAAGGAAIKYLTGLTPGNTLAVTVGLGGTGASYTGGNGVVIFEW